MNMISFPSELIAPCGMNCGICMAYLRKKNHCSGCNSGNLIKSRHCENCHFRKCGDKATPSTFCNACKKYPCLNLKKLDKRYRTKYGMSMIENLDKIKDLGLKAFIEVENTRWACPECGNPICVHHQRCSSCGKSFATSTGDKKTVQ